MSLFIIELRELNTDTGCRWRENCTVSPDSSLIEETTSVSGPDDAGTTATMVPFQQLDGILNSTAPHY
ncbi:hypothetical protein JT305_09885 [Salmonella enterica subsp. enterica serovar Senftenberg]|nr:hypothetical protein [Salmonella enterica subsp. enterica serovar Senftenberg]